MRLERCSDIPKATQPVRDSCASAHEQSRFDRVKKMNFSCHCALETRCACLPAKQMWGSGQSRLGVQPPGPTGLTFMFCFGYHTYLVKLEIVFKGTF